MWNDLTMSERASVIKMAVKAGLRDMKSIRDFYDKSLSENSYKYVYGGPKVSRLRPAPRPAQNGNNRFANMSDEETEALGKDVEEYWKQQEEELKNRTPEQVKQMGIEADRKWKQKYPNGSESSPRVQKVANTIMSALSNSANSLPFTGDAVIKAAEDQRQEKINKWHEYRNGIDSFATGAELLAAGYGVGRGLAHLERMFARKAATSSGQAISREALERLSKWNKIVKAVDKQQVLMNGVGGIADGYQWITANNSFDRWENGIETGSNVAGVIGGMNWFRDFPYLRSIGGRKIDSILDTFGYSAAAWDVVKNLPPLSDALDGIRRQTTNTEENKKAEGGPKVTLVDNDKVRMSPSGTFSDDNGNIIGDSIVLPEVSVRPTTPQTNNSSYYQQWLMRQADRGGKNMSSSDREAYDKMMSRVANQNEVKNFTGFDGTIYNHGNGALEQVSPEFDILTLGRQLYTDGLLSSIGNVGKNALKKAHIGNYYIKPQYNDYSYIRQVGDDAVEDMLRTNQMRSTVAIEREQRAWDELGALLGNEPKELSRMIPDGKGSMTIPFKYRLNTHKLFEDQMYYTGRPFYGDTRTNYLVTNPRSLTDRKNLTNKGLEWIESNHKNHTGIAKAQAKAKGTDPNTAPGRIVVPLWNGEKNVIPVDALGEFDLYRPVKLGNINMPFYRRYSMPVNKKAEGGSIHIAPSKRGTFTAAATKHGMGVQEFASKVLANKDNYSSAMVKKANFAKNASKWKHGLGGYLFI